MEKADTEFIQIASRIGLDPHQVTRTFRSQKTFHGILSDLGFRFSPHKKILDVGCGLGTRVYQYRRQGLRAFGVDVCPRFGLVDNMCQEEGLSDPDLNIFNIIPLNDYRFPFEDNEFDFIYSDQLLEHVQDLSHVLSEVHRVLKDGGLSVHIFPPRWLVIEPHVYVPLAGGIPKKWYLRFWAAIGIRKKSQKGLNSWKVVQENYDYLRKHTYYRSYVELEAHFHRHFSDVRHVEDLFIKHTPLLIHHGYPFCRFLPFSRRLVAALMQIAVCFVKRS